MEVVAKRGLGGGGEEGGGWVEVVKKGEVG